MQFDASEKGKMSARDIGIVAATILAVLLAAFMGYRFIMADAPQPQNEAPKNVVGTSEKAMEMKRQGQMSGGAEAAPARSSIGDDVQPPIKP